MQKSCAGAASMFLWQSLVYAAEAVAYDGDDELIDSRATAPVRLIMARDSNLPPSSSSLPLKHFSAEIVSNYFPLQVEVRRCVYHPGGYYTISDHNGKEKNHQVFVLCYFLLFPNVFDYYHGR